MTRLYISTDNEEAWKLVKFLIKIDVIKNASVWSTALDDHLIVEYMSSFM